MISYQNPGKAVGSTRRSHQLQLLLDQLNLPSGRLDEAALARVVLAVASSPSIYDDLVVDDPAHRWWMTLHEARNFDLRVLSWGPDQSSGWHDHGGSSGAFTVTSGAVAERSRADDAVGVTTRDFSVGQFATFGPGHVHDVEYMSGHPAVSIHAYSPPLTGLTYYERTELGFVARGVVDEERRSAFETPSGRPVGV